MKILVADMQDDVGGIQVKQLETELDKRGRGDVGQLGQQQQREGNSDTAEADKWNDNKKDVRQCRWWFCKIMMAYVHYNEDRQRQRYGENYDRISRGAR